MKPSQHLIGVLAFLFCSFSVGQWTPGVYMAQVGNTYHELKLSDDYLVLSIYEKSPAKFVKTMGGFYTLDPSGVQVKLEFNSNFKDDSLKTWSTPYTIRDNALVLPGTPELVFKPVKESKQDLEGAWLFATRGPDKGQERRGDGNPRKTLKFLKDGRFQWIAYNTDTMDFFGTGGGAFSAQNGQYVEDIAYFSRDNSRVGASLTFNYEIKDGDWHHMGKNSKGEPMYEIWSPR